MAEIVLSPLDPADVPIVLGMLGAAGLPTVGVEENPGAFVVARIGSEVVGCGGVEVHGCDGLLRSVVVDQRYRRRGIAKVIVEHVLALPRSANVASIYLLTTTARDFFPRFGFRVCPRDEAPDTIRASWEFTTGCPDSAVFMSRPGN